VFKNACAQGIVSKRLGSPYRSGRFGWLAEGQKLQSTGRET
jgi:hypothetical protein